MNSLPTRKVVLIEIGSLSFIAHILRWIGVACGAVAQRFLVKGAASEFSFMGWYFRKYPNCLGNWKPESTALLALLHGNTNGVLLNDIRLRLPTDFNG